MKIKALKIFLNTFCLFLVSFVVAGGAHAATLEFSPSTGSHTTGEGFDVEIKVDTSDTETTSTDAVIVFDKTLVSIDNVTYGSFYPTVLHSEQNGKLYISGMVDSAGDSKSGTGTLATVTLKGLTAGTATLSFECETGRTDDSNISENDLDSTDVIDCSALDDASFTFTGGAVSTPEPTAAPTTPPGTDTNNDTDTTTTTTSSTGGTTTTIPSTGALDFLKLVPKIFMGLLFIAAGIIPLII